MQLAFFLVLAAVCKAVRFQRKAAIAQEFNASDVPYGWRMWTMVDGLFTFGAPMSTGEAMPNPIARDGCFHGWRSVREGKHNGKNSVDLVSTLLTYNGFRHPKMPTMIVNQARPAQYFPCGWEYNGDTRSPTAALHSRSVYSSLTMHQVGAVAKVALVNSYDFDVKRVAERARAAGWGLAGTAFARGKWLWWTEDEVSHLFQHPKTLNCMLTFEGTTSVSNWADNINFIKWWFCGLPGRVHRGFRDAMRLMTRSDSFKQNIKRHLPKCNKLDVVGHSLGGAISTLYSACGNNAYFAESDEDNRDIRWIKGKPAKLTYK